MLYLGCYEAYYAVELTNFSQILIRFWSTKIGSDTILIWKLSVLYFIELKLLEARKKRLYIVQYVIDV